MMKEKDTTRKGEASRQILHLTGQIKKSMLSVEEKVTEVARLEATLKTGKEELKSLVNEHNKYCRWLLFEEMKRQELTWCTCCLQIIPEANTEFLFISRLGDFSTFFVGFETAGYVARLERVCPPCRERVRAFNEWQSGPDEEIAKNQAFFFAFRVQEREDGFHSAWQLDPDSLEKSMPWEKVPGSRDLLAARLSE
jgi:hypothetical protein